MMIMATAYCHETSSAFTYARIVMDSEDPATGCTSCGCVCADVASCTTTVPNLGCGSQLVAITCPMSCGGCGTTTVAASITTTSTTTATTTPLLIPGSVMPVLNEGQSGTPLPTATLPQSTFTPIVTTVPTTPTPTTAMLSWSADMPVPNSERVVAEVVERLRRGEVVGLPTDTIYGIGCLAQDTSAVNR